MRPQEWEIEYEWISDYKFYIEKFCYFLLSPEFVDKYKKEYEFAIMDDWFDLQYYVKEFSIAIYEYQSWNEQSLIDLLSKI